MRFLQNDSNTPNNNAGYRLSVFAHCLLWVLLVLLVSRQVMPPPLNTISHFGISSENGITTIVDFASIFNFTKAFWLEQLPTGISAYSVANHLRVTSDWLGHASIYSLSFGYSPTMLWLLAPMVHFSHALSYFIFNSAGLLAIWWQTQPGRCRYGLGLLAFLSPLAMTCFQNGQTALLTGAGLLFLSERSRERFEMIISWRMFFSALALWALTAKPPLAITAGAVLLGLRQWHPVLLAALLTLVTTLIISPVLGAGWITDYLHLITTHNQLQADPAFAFSHVPQRMANLRGVLSVDFNVPDNIAARTSSFIWLATLIVLVASGPFLRLTVGGFWSIGVLLYLLFCPHVSSMEVLQVVLLLPFCLPTTSEKLGWKELVLMFVVPLLPFATPVQLDNRMILFSGLLFLLGFVFYLCQEKPEISCGHQE